MTLVTSGILAALLTVVARLLIYYFYERRLRERNRFEGHPDRDGIELQVGDLVEIDGSRGRVASRHIDQRISVVFSDKPGFSSRSTKARKVQHDRFGRWCA